MAKPVPTLADDMLFNTNRMLISREAFEQTKAALRQARQFVFDDEAATRLGEIMRLYPEFIADHSQFVRLPFDPCWVEFDSRVMRRALLKGVIETPEQEEQQYGPSSDKRVGFLYTKNRIFVAAAREDSLGQFSPLVYNLHQPMTYEREIEMAERLRTSRGQLDYLFWGNSYRSLDQGRQRALRRDHGIEFLLDHRFDGRDFGNLVDLSASDLRNAITVLLLINRPSNFKTLGERERAKGLSRGSFRTFMAHTVVTIKLASEPVVRQTGRTVIREHGRHRRHEVRGHFAHNEWGRSKTCTHNWVEYEPNRWECTKCPGKRWWKKDHMRGDASLGFVTKHYAIEKGNRTVRPNYGRQARPPILTVPATDRLGDLETT